MRNKKTKKIGGSRVRTANLLEDIKAAIPLHYTLVCTSQMHFNFFLLSICSAKDYMSAQSAPTPPRHLCVRLILAASIHPPTSLPAAALPAVVAWACRSSASAPPPAPLLRLRRPSLLPLLRRLEATGHWRPARPAPSRNLGALPGRRAIPKPRRPARSAHPEALPPPTRGTPSSTPRHPKAVHC
jgi:hypothetical protein